MDSRQLIDTLKMSDLRGMGGAGRTRLQQVGRSLRVEGGAGRGELTESSATPTRASCRPSRTARSCSGAPHLVVEGMVLVRLWWGRQKGTSRSRHLYFNQIHAVEAEIQRARGSRDPRD